MIGAVAVIWWRSPSIDPDDAGGGGRRDGCAAIDPDDAGREVVPMDPPDDSERLRPAVIWWRSP
ncbi:MAG: hypothetical protein IKP58_15605 [Victivallales bacterium]|nr:hypothetical protein [Victivallales bacterium]